MAKKITRDDNAQIDAGELQSLLDSALEQASKASEYTAEHGNIIRLALDRFGIDRTAFSMARRLYKQEESRREATLRDFIKVCGLLGFFDQRAAFDDVFDALAERLGGKVAKKAAK